MATVNCQLVTSVCVAAALACGCSAGAQASRWPSWLTACDALGRNEAALCGTVSVPESVDAPGGRQLALRVVVVPARTRTAASPLLILAGGPGQGAAALARALAQRAGALRERRDLILVDQRGTGGSNGLQCSPAASARELMGHIFEPSRLAACRDRLMARADLTRYTTAHSAPDYEVILNALGVKQVDVWGVSYGTRLGYELARRFPGRVRTLTLESVVPVSFAWPTTGARDLEAAINTIVDDCAGDRACAEAYPNVRRDIGAAYKRLAGGPQTVAVIDPASNSTERVSFSNADLSYAVRGILYGAESRQLPAMFARAAAGRFDDLAQAYVTRVRTLDDQVASGVLLSVYCAEDLPFVDWPAAQRAAEGTRIGSYLLDEYRRGCEIWPQGSIPSGFRDLSRLDVPALLFSGRHDPVTPPRTAQDLAAALPRSRRLVWRFGGHGIDGIPGAAACRNRIVDDFLTAADPSRVSTGCMDH